MSLSCAAEPNMTEETALQIHFMSSKVAYFLFLPYLCVRSCFSEEIDIY